MNTIQNEKVYIYGVFSDVKSSNQQSSKILVDIPGLNIESLSGGTNVDENTIYSLFNHNIRDKDRYVTLLKTNYYDDPNKLSKSDILKELKLYFEGDSGSRNYFILFLSGHGFKDKFYLSTNTNDEEFICYDDIANTWLNRNYQSKSQHILIVIDACSSGAWVDKNEESFNYGSHKGISVLSSCNCELSKSHPEYGGSLIFGLNALNNIKRGDNLKKEFREYIEKHIKYNPRLSGFYNIIKSKFQLNVFIDNSYEDVSSLANETRVMDNGKFQGYVKNNKFFLGIYYYNDGNRYNGEWKDGNKHGKGIFYFNDGDRYDGEWKDGNKHGKGLLYFNNGSRYDGEWKDDNKHGKGIFYFNNDSRYDGEWKDGNRHGKGIYYFNNGSRYHGELKDDKFNGKGIFYFNSGNRYDGEWKDDKKYGKGIYYFNDDDHYDGEWKDDKKHGKGIYYFNDGDHYDGEWKDDKKHGKGIFYYKSGNRCEEEWKDGIRIDENSNTCLLI